MSARLPFRKLGFTMVELILVISIIGVLATIAVTSYSEARQQARDDIRISQLEQLRMAIELYKSENGVYPSPGCGTNFYGGAHPEWAGSETYSAAATWLQSCPTDYIQGLVPDFIQELPRDLQQQHDGGFVYASNGTAFKLLVHHVVESKLVTSFDHPYARVPRAACWGTPVFPGQSNVYAVYSAGAECW